MVMIKNKITNTYQYVQLLNKGGLLFSSDIIKINQSDFDQGRRLKNPELNKPIARPMINPICTRFRNNPII